MSEYVSCKIENSIAYIAMDDGKNNLLTPLMIDQLNNALDTAEKQNAIVVLTGRPGVFSAGFDLKTMQKGGGEALKMLNGGFALSGRLLAFPTPVIIACSGHAVAMGCFLTLSGDYRIGVVGDYKIVANEVEIGLPMPESMIETCRQRLKPGYLDRAVMMSECFGPSTAVDAGFFDRVVSAESLHLEAKKLAERYLTLDMHAHKLSKLRLRRDMLKKHKRALLKDRIGVVKMGLARMLKGRAR